MSQTFKVVCETLCKSAFYHCNKNTEKQLIKRKKGLFWFVLLEVSVHDWLTTLL